MNQLQKDMLRFIRRANKAVTVSMLAKQFKLKIAEVETELDECDRLRTALEDSGKGTEEIYKESFDAAIRKLKSLINSADSEISLKAIQELSKISSLNPTKNFSWRK